MLELIDDIQNYLDLLNYNASKLNESDIEKLNLIYHTVYSMFMKLDNKR